MGHPVDFHFSDTIQKTKYNLSGIFERGNLAYYTGSGESIKLKRNWFGRTDFQLNTTGTTYPSNKLSLNIANLTKSKLMRFFNMYFQLNGIYDVEILLEDSRRKFHSFFFKCNIWQYSI